MTLSALNDEMWGIRAPVYQELTWVGASQLLAPFDYLRKERLSAEQQDLLVDLGTGTGAVLLDLEEDFTHGGIGVDISPDMLGQIESKNGSKLIRGDTTRLPLAPNIADMATARMVMHHLVEPGKLLQEAHRVLRPGGLLVVSEYIPAVVPDTTLQSINCGDPVLSNTLINPPSDEMFELERSVFNAKEPDRWLWREHDLVQMIEQVGDFQDVQVHYAILPPYSVQNWLKKGNLPDETRRKIINLYLNASDEVKREMRMQFVVQEGPDSQRILEHSQLNGHWDDESGDILIPRPFVYVSAIKQD